MLLEVMKNPDHVWLGPFNSCKIGRLLSHMMLEKKSIQEFDELNLTLMPRVRLVLHHVVSTLIIGCIK